MKVFKMTTSELVPKKNASIRQNNYLFIAGISFLIYFIGESIDCVYILLIGLNMVPNVDIYSTLFYLEQVTSILESSPILFLPLFLSFTLMRFFSALGILRNRMWGFYIGIISLVLTMLLTVLFLPLGFLELFLCTLILFLLLIGYFGKKPILS